MSKMTHNLSKDDLKLKICLKFPEICLKWEVIDKNECFFSIFGFSRVNFLPEVDIFGLLLAMLTFCTLRTVEMKQNLVERTTGDFKVYFLPIIFVGGERFVRWKCLFWRDGRRCWQVRIFLPVKTRQFRAQLFTKGNV